MKKFHRLNLRRDISINVGKYDWMTQLGPIIQTSSHILPFKLKIPQLNLRWVRVPALIRHISKQYARPRRRKLSSFICQNFVKITTWQADKLSLSETELAQLNKSLNYIFTSCYSSLWNATVEFPKQAEMCWLLGGDLRTIQREAFIRNFFTMKKGKRRETRKIKEPKMHCNHKFSIVLSV